MTLKQITTKLLLIKDKLKLEHKNLLFYTCPNPPIKYKLRLSTCKGTQHYWMLHVAYLSKPCCMLLGVVVQSFKPVKILSQRLPLFFCSVISEAQHNNVGSVAQFFEHCWDPARTLHPRCFAGPNIVGRSFHAI